MQVRHYTGKVVDVSDQKAHSLVGSGSWRYVNQADKPVEAVKKDPEGGDTLDAPLLPQEPSEPQEETKPAATIQEMRKWGLENDIEGARPQGKLARTVIEAYMEAHKNEE